MTYGHVLVRFGDDGLQDVETAARARMLSNGCWADWPVHEHLRSFIVSDGKLLECSFLIPIRGDADLSDGDEHRIEDWDWLSEEMFARFGGGTVAPGL